MAARPALPALPLTGGCLCGAVRYRIDARPLAVNACHCLHCQRLSGTDATVSLHLKAEAVSVEGELVRYRRTADSGRQIDAARCAACGTRLFHEPVSVPELVLVAAGTLDDAGWAIPVSHIWLSRSNGSFVPAADALAFQESAPDRQTIWGHFAALYPAAP
ncbi:hypothetical protein sos41_41600 [Alphaproteobacteria bacterium SO-S41]|nr:hypothetical protein sos41_41600 [Alphaproteobacteria bacterium SO-S41]